MSQPWVITVTASSAAYGYSQHGSKGPVMTVSGWQLNRFERFLFWAAIVLGGILIVARLGAMLLLTILHHTR
jgi:hypothetical protein